MDEDLLVQEIVKSLAFEIEAVNKDNILKWTTTNGTPLNVKVRVRNKDEPRLVQRGPIPVPRIGISAPEKLRLVSSDQTILSFNVYLEDELDKQDESKRRNAFKMFNIGGCLGTYSDDEGPYLPGSSNQKALGSTSSSKSDSGILNEKVAIILGTSNTLLRNQKSFFGKCKPGGCLDPPFDEDKIPYGLPKTNRQDILKFELHKLEKNKQTYKPGGCLDPPFGEDKYAYAPVKTDRQQTYELELHELEINDEKISIRSVESHKKHDKRLSEHKPSAQKTTKDEVDSKQLTDIYARTSRQNSLTSKYSNSILTYPTDMSSTETLYDQIPNKRMSTKNHDEELQRQSYDYPESYFVPPKDVMRSKEEQRRSSRELSNDQIRRSTEAKVNDMPIKTKLNKTENVENKYFALNTREIKDNKKFEGALTEKQRDDDDNEKDDVLRSHLPPAFKEMIPYILTGSKNVNDNQNVPQQNIKCNFQVSPKSSVSSEKIKNIQSKQQMFPSESENSTKEKRKIIEENVNVETSNIKTMPEIPIEIYATEKSETNVLKTDETYEISSYTNKFFENVGTETRLLDERQTVYPTSIFQFKQNKNTVDAILTDSKNSSNDSVLSSHKDKSDIAEIADNNNILPESFSDASIVNSALHHAKNDHDKDEQKHAMTHLPKNKTSNVSPTQSANTVALNQPYFNNAQNEGKDFNHMKREENESISKKPEIKGKSYLDITAEKDNASNLVDFNQNKTNRKRSKQDIKLLKQPLLLTEKLEITNSLLSPYQDNEGNAEDNNSEIKRYRRPEDADTGMAILTTATIIMSEKMTSKSKDKLNLVTDSRKNENDIAIFSKLHPENHPDEKIVHKFEGNQNEQKNVSPDQILSTENTDFDISSTHSVDSKHEPSRDGARNHLEDLHGQQYISSAKLYATNIDNVIIQNDYLRDKNIKLTPESLDNKSNAILQKTPFIPRQDSDVHDDEFNKRNPLKRNTFSIIESDTSLRKREGIEEIQGNITNLKTIDKSVSPGQTHDKNQILDTRGKKPEHKIYTDSSEQLLQNHVQKNVNGMESKTIDIGKPMNNYRNKKDSLDKINNEQENKIITDLVISERSDKNNRTPDNKINLVIDSLQKEMPLNVKAVSPKISETEKSAFITQFPNKIELLDISNQKQNRKKYSGTLVSTIQIHTKEEEDIQENVNIQPKTIPLHMGNKEPDCKTSIENPIESNREDIYSRNSDNSNVDYISPIQYETELLEITRKEHKSSIYDGLDVDLIQKAIPKDVKKLHATITHTGKSTPPTLTQDKLQSLGKGNQDLENITYSKSDINTPQKPNTKYFSELDSKVIDNDKCVPHNLQNFYFKSNVSDKLVSAGTITNKTEPLDIRNKELINDNDRLDLQYSQQCISEKSHDLPTYTTLIQDRAKDVRTNNKDQDKIFSDATVKEPKKPFLGHGIDSHSKDGKLVSEEIRLLEISGGTGLGSSKKYLPEDVKDFYSLITDENSAISTKNYAKPDIFSTENKQLDNITYNNANKDMSPITVSKSDFYLKLTGAADGKVISVSPTKMTDENREKIESLNAKYKEPSSLIIRKSAAVSSSIITKDNINNFQSQITNDGKYISTDQAYGNTDLLDTKSSKSLTKIQRHSSFEMLRKPKSILNTSAGETKADITNDYIDDGKRREQKKYIKLIESQVFKENKNHELLLRPELSNDNENTKSILENQPPGYCISDNQVLRNISEDAEGEQIISARTIGPEDSKRYDNIANLDVDRIQYQETFENKSANIGENLMSTTSTISAADFALKVDSSYNVPRNTSINIPMATVKAETDGDSNKKITMESFQSIKYKTYDSDQLKHRAYDRLINTSSSKIISNRLLLNDRTDITDQNGAYIDVSVNESNEDNIGIKSTFNMSHDESFRSHRQPSLDKQKERFSSSHQIILERQNRTQSSVNMSFYIYVNDVNQKVVQTCSPLQQQQQSDGTVTAVKAYVYKGGEIRIPLDKENDLALNIVDKDNRTCKRGSVTSSSTSYTRREKHVMDRTKKHSDVLNKNLALIYESELIPLYNVIKDLTQEVNTLTAKQETLQLRMRNTKRSKSLRSFPVKRCGCRRI